jgi:hypothetical protein
MDIPIVTDDKGQKVFIGRDDPNNPPVRPLEGSKMQCPVCNNYFDYLVGDDINGGVRGCESCWKPPVEKERRTHEPIATTKEVFD